MNQTQQIDARTLRCPMPLLKLKMALANLPVGSKVELLATDIASQKDIPAFIALSRHELLKQQTVMEKTLSLNLQPAATCYRFIVLKGE